jgi:outer membrane lipoprotein-sorting protein
VNALRIAAAAAIAAALALTSSTALASPAGDAALAAFSSAWDGVHSYTCTITAHEVLDSDVQDRVYNAVFERPNNVRMDIIGGAGKGGAAIWNGGDTVYGHEGGFLSFIRLHLNIHDSKAVSLRGTTIAQSSFGALLQRFKDLKTSSLDAKTAGGETTVTANVLDPASDDGVTSEVLILGADHLPTTYTQFEGTKLVNHVSYWNYKANVAIPDSTWKL